MRIGPKEREILLRLNEAEFTPPSIYLAGNYGNCPGSPTWNRIVHEKRLAVAQVMTWTPEECLARMGELPPGYLTAERNAALRLTKQGAEVVENLRKPNEIANRSCAK